MNLRKLLMAAGFPVPKAHAAGQWRQRNRVPHTWLATILWVLCEVHGQPLERFLRQAEPNPLSPGPTGGHKHV